MAAQRSPEDVIRAFFHCCTDGRPDLFADVVADDYLDYGHDPAGRGPEGARADYDNAVRQAGGITRYTIDALVVDDDAVAAAWTGDLPAGKQMKGLSLYRVTAGKLRQTRHTLMQ